MTDERVDNKITIFCGKKGNDLQLWAKYVTIALRGKELTPAIRNDQIKEGNNEKALSIIVPALGTILFEWCRNVEIPKRFGIDCMKDMLEDLSATS